MSKHINYKTTVPLFDIDLTLIRGKGGTGGRAFEHAIKKVFNIDVSMTNIIPHGMIDPQIYTELLTAHGYGHIEITPEQGEQLMRAYEEFYFEFNKTNPSVYEVLPGVLKLLERLFSEHYLIGVLTGNIEKVAKFKLKKALIGDYISLGLFGNMAYKRSELSELAKIEVKKYFPADAQPQLVVIGDTHLDILAAHEAGLPAIGVASGKQSIEELAAAGAEAVVRSLEDAEEFTALMEKVARR